MRGRGWLLVFMAAVGCAKASDPSILPTHVVKRIHFQRTVTADGHLVPVQTTVITAPRGSDGPMRVAWLLEEGHWVKKGEVVVRLDAQEYKTRLLKAKDDKVSAGAKIAKENLLAAQAQSDRQRTTQAARRELALARNFERKDTELYSRDDIITYEIDEKLQSARALHAQNAESVDRQVAQRKLQILGVEAKVADEAKGRAQKALNMLEVRAPHDGVFMVRRNFRGETTSIGDLAWGPLAEVSQSNTLEANVFVLEVEASGLAKGKKAEIVLLSQPGVVFQGEVARVETVAKRRQFRSPTQYFEVTLSLANTDGKRMRPGQRVRATLHLDERETLVVPRPALFQKGGTWLAYRQSGNGFLPTPVVLGASTAGLVAVESGLSEGDIIALRDPAQSADEILSPSSPTPGKRP